MTGHPRRVWLWWWCSMASALACLTFSPACSTVPPPSARGDALTLPPEAPRAAPAPPDDPAIARRGILRRAGEHIVDATGQPVVLRGVAFGNQVWSGRALPVQHHDEADFERVRAMGMNAVRFYMFYGTFEDDAAPFVYKASGWQWLDRNVAWARRHGVYLILNLHVPQGGFQSNGAGRALWEVPANQDRFVALWRAIAARYAREPVVAGYDLLNEPGVTRDKAQWQALATRAIKAIREVDDRHVVVVERVNSIAQKWSNDPDMNFFLVGDDSNVVYTFHFYEPFGFTHQLASWAKLGEGGRYPDARAVAHAGDTRWLGIATFDSPKLPPGDSPWTYAASPPLTVRDPRATIGHVSLVARKVGAGRAIFDEIAVDVLGGGGRPGEATPTEILRLDTHTLGGWFYWSADKSGHASTIYQGHGARVGALAIGDTTGDANLGSWQHEIRLEEGRTYVVRGWMRGERLPPDAEVQIRLDFLGSDGPVMSRDKAFLRAELDRYLAWGHAHHVPLYLGEFGLHRPCFENGRGGLAWVEDMLDLAAESQLSFTYHAYHEDAFGLYLGSGPVDPSHANRPLIDLLTRKLAAHRVP